MGLLPCAQIIVSKPGAPTATWMPQEAAERLPGCWTLTLVTAALGAVIQVPESW